MIELEQVHKSYGSVKAVDGVSFSVGGGEVFGLLGPNGAGKTTILKLLTGYHYPDSGVVRIASQDVSADPLAVKRRLGYLPENAPLYEDFTVLEYLEFAARARAVPPARHAERCRVAIEACGLSAVLHRPIVSLSKGFRQRTGLAQAIVHDPEILVLDEPTSGLDPNQILEIRRLIRNLGHSKTVILSTHIMQEVEALCDRVLILNRGRVAAAGTATQIAAELGGAQRFSVTVIAPPGKDESVFDDIANLAGVQNARVRQSAGAALISAEISLLGDGGADYAGAEALFDWAVERGFKLVKLQSVHHSLEELFVELTQ